MAILFTICGRAGSKGIRNKNIRDFLDKPLPLYGLSAIELFLKDNDDVEYDIVLNTDSEELIDIFENNNILKTDVIRRDKELAGDAVAKMDVIKNCLIEMESRKDREYEMVVDLDITCPLRTKYDVENIIEKKSSTDYDLIFSVTDSRRNPYFNMVEERDGSYDRVITSDFDARQQAPAVYDINGSLYAYSRDFLLNKNNLFAGKSGIYRMRDTGVVDLDHENDFELMQVIAKYLLQTDDDFREIYDNIR